MREEEFQTKEKITWCPGCGNFGIFEALKKAFSELNLRPNQILVVYGIGCHGNMCNWLKTYGFEGLHGRAIPVGIAAKLANPKLTVIVIAGDGDQLGEGTNHLIHAARKNPNIKCIIHDNGLYALTVSEASPTSPQELKTRSTPEGSFDLPLNPLSLAIAADASFVARGFSGKIDHLAWLLKEAILHKGFALIDVLQPCVTFNYLNTYSWYYQRVYEMHPDYDLNDKISAFKKSLESGEKIPLGIFYKVERKTLEENLLPDPSKILIEEDISDIKIEELFLEFQ